MAPSSPQRRELRRQLRKARLDFASGPRREAERAICQHLLELPEVHAARRITAYAAAKGEVDLSSALSALTERGNHLSLPRVRGDEMEFVDWRAGQARTPGPFGIREPSGEEVHPFSEHDVALVPLVAFDRHGNRLGQGGGFYDRAIAAAQPRPFLIGIAYQLQEVPVVPTAPWDMPLDAVVTELGPRRFAGAEISSQEHDNQNLSE